eukprot:1291792-Amphidinium_carterae.1
MPKLLANIVLGSPVDESWGQRVYLHANDRYKLNAAILYDVEHVVVAFPLSIRKGQLEQMLQLSVTDAYFMSDAAHDRFVASRRQG